MQEEKWSVFVVVFHACIEVPASCIRSKVCYLNQRRGAGNYSYCTIPENWLIAWVAKRLCWQEAGVIFTGDVHMRYRFHSLLCKTKKFLLNNRQTGRHLWEIWEHRRVTEESNKLLFSWVFHILAGWKSWCIKLAYAKSIGGKGPGQGLHEGNEGWGRRHSMTSHTWSCCLLEFTLLK